MKLLCLHGYGTSALIFEQQMRSIMDALGKEHEYVFLDGDFPVGQSEYSRTFSKPYFAYYPSTQKSVHKAHELISAVIDGEDEPFDGILGFSQGAALAISYLLHHQIENPDVPSPFRFGVFFDSYACVSPDPDYKQNELMSFLAKLTPANAHDLHSRIIDRRSYPTPQQIESLGSFTPRERRLASTLIGHLGSALMVRTALGINDPKDGLDDLRAEDIKLNDFPRFFHPVYTEERITIPTVHISSASDAGDLTTIAAVNRELCSGGKVEFVQHDGHHDIPRKPNEVERIVAAIRQASYFAQMSAIVV